MSAVAESPTLSESRLFVERVRSVGVRALILGLPFLWVLFLVVLPLLYLVTTSLWESSLGEVIQDWSFENYQRAATSAVVQTALWRTFLIAFAAAAIATVVAYPLAYVVVRRMGRFKLAVALLVLVPLWVSYLMRVFAWRIILGEQGVLNGLLTSTGVLSEPSSAFLYSVPTVILTLCYVAIPYVFLSSFVALDRIPSAMFEASGDCGASNHRTFWNVVWPLSRPGAVVGFAIGFVLPWWGVSKERWSVPLFFNSSAMPTTGRSERRSQSRSC
jgi:spermidine/putrescine transport system permease protein